MYCGRLQLRLAKCSGPRSGRTSWPVSRILFPTTAAQPTVVRAATIHLGTPLPGTSSGLPAGSGEQPSNTCAATLSVWPSWPCFGWGLPSHPGHPGCWCALTAPFHPYHHEGGGLFSVALSRESPRIAVNNHPALRSPDFPRLGTGPLGPAPAAAAQPTRPRTSPYSLPHR